LRALARTLACVGFAVSVPAQAHAHLVNTRLGDFYGGMLHPLTGIEDMLPWFALAVLAALQGPQRARWLIAVFPLGLLAGAVLSIYVPALPISPAVGAGLLAVTGLAVAAAVKLPLPLLVVLGTAIALLHGYHNGQAMAASTDPLLFICGLTATGYVYLTVLTAIGIAFLEGTGGWRPIALRAGGSWAAAVGLMVLGLQLRGHVPL
jgi:urease accessory protein